MFSVRRAMNTFCGGMNSLRAETRSSRSNIISLTRGTNSLRDGMNPF
jgi:hypothetical protein